jgi:hypothetical protein
VLNALDELNGRPAASEELRDLWVRDLEPGMTVDQDVMARNGLMLLARGQEVTPSVIARLTSFRDTHGVVEPFRVQVVHTETGA